MRFFPVACFICCAVASVWTVSLASSWVNRDVLSRIVTVETFVLTRSLVDVRTECGNMSSRTPDFGLSGFLPLSVSELIFNTDSRASKETPIEQEEKSEYSLRRHNVAFNPVYFDDIYSIDKRGNTLHFVDDVTSVAKRPYPLLPALRRVFHPALKLLKFAIPVGINIAQSTK